MTHVLNLRRQNLSNIYFPGSYGLLQNYKIQQSNMSKIHTRVCPIGWKVINKCFRIPEKPYKSLIIIVSQFIIRIPFQQGSAKSTLT